MKKFIIIIFLLFMGCKSTYIPKEYNNRPVSKGRYYPTNHWGFIASCLVVGFVAIYTGYKINTIN